MAFADSALFEEVAQLAAVRRTQKTIQRPPTNRAPALQCQSRSITQKAAPVRCPGSGERINASPTRKACTPAAAHASDVGRSTDAAFGDNDSIGRAPRGSKSSVVCDRSRKRTQVAIVDTDQRGLEVRSARCNSDAS